MATFADDFNRADSTNLGAGWVEVSGDWSIVSNQLSSGSAGGTIILRAAGAMDTSDNFAQITIAATAAVSHGVWCRGNSNITSGYLWRNDGVSWNLFSVVGGSFTSIGSFAGAAVAGDVAKIQAVGTTIRGFVNGVQRVSVTDTNVATGTSVGVRAESTSSLRFDDFSAGDVTAGATLGVASSVETAQLLAGAKIVALSPAASAEAAQPITGAKTGALAVADVTESAQALPGAKTGALGVSAATEAVQQLTGGKTATLGTALEVSDARALAGTKAAPLPGAAQTETAQPLTGGKTATLGVAVETSTARPLAATGGAAAVTITVSAPFTPWTAAQAPRRWTAAEAPGPWTVKEAP